MKRGSTACRLGKKVLGHHVPALAYFNGEPRAFCKRCGIWLEDAPPIENKEK